MAINIQKLHNELLAAGLPVMSVREIEPYATYERVLSPAEKLVAEGIIYAHDGKPEKDVERIDKLKEEGINNEKLLLILADKVFNAKNPSQSVLDLLK